MEREREMNAATFERTTGRDVRYGQVIQLRHSITGAFVSVGRQAALLNREGRRVTIDEGAGEAGWFRVMPKLRIHSEGERVRLGDPIVLEHVGTSLRLRTERVVGRLPDGRREVSATLEMAALKLSLYRPFIAPPHGEEDGEESSTSPLYGGAAVRLVYEEMDGYLAAIASDLLPPKDDGSIASVAEMAFKRHTHSETSVAGGGASSAALVASAAHDEASADTMWEVLHQDVTSGRAHEWGGRVWVAHGPSGRALAVLDAEGDDGSDLPLGMIGFAPGDAVAERRGLFELVPMSSSAAGAIKTDNLFRLRHVQTGR